LHGRDPSEERTTYRGVRWRRREGVVSFYDPDSDRWIPWSEHGGCPPLPPRWSLLGVPTKVTRPGWRSPWRIVPLVLVIGAVAIAVIQAISPAPDAPAKQRQAALALVGKCLPEHGTSGGHPDYSASPVACDSAKAAVKVVSAVASTPSGPGCPAGTFAVVIPYLGVKYPVVDSARAIGGGG